MKNIIGKKKLWLKKKGNGAVIVAGATVNLDSGNAASYPGSGTNWFDLTANNYDATLRNGVGFSAANGGVLTFDGNNDDVLGNTGYSITLSTKFTIETWFYLDTFVGFPALFEIKTNTSFSYICFLSQSHVNYGINNIVFGSGTEFGSWVNMNTDDSTFASGNWYQVVFTYNGGSAISVPNFKLYVNNINKTLKTNSIAFGGTSQVNTNASLNGGQVLHGKLPIFNFYDNKEFNVTEVQQNFDFYKTRFGL